MDSGFRFGISAALHRRQQGIDGRVHLGAQARQCYHVKFTAASQCRLYYCATLCILFFAFLLELTRVGQFRQDISFAVHEVNFEEV
jgi:hypothetical protein